jgi:hypothetical protein
LGKLFISPENYDAGSVVVAEHLIRLHTYSRIQTHPFDLLANRSESIETISFTNEVDWHDVRLVIA